MPSSPLASLMRQIETDLRSPVPPQAPLTPPRFDAEQYFAEGGAVHMAGGGFRDPNDPLGGLAVDPNDPRQWLQFGGQDIMQAPFAGLPVGQAVGTSVGYHTVEGLQDAAKLANQVLAGEVDPRSDEGIQRAMNAAMTAQLGGIGGAPARAGEVVLGSGPVRRVAEAAAVERELSPMGFYSYGAETALGLPQAKGTPQQMAGVLRQAGVRPEELFTSGFADEAATMARRTQIEAEYAPKIEAAKQAVDALNPESPEFAKALLDPKSPESKAKRQYDNTVRSMRGDAENALVLSEDFASRPSVTREEIAAHFKEKMPQIEETVLGSPKFKDVNEMQAAHDAALERGDTAAANRITQDWESQFEGNTKFGQYTLPGGENYREVLLKLPSDAKAPTFEQWYEKTHIKPLESYADDPRMMEMFRNKYDAEVKNMPKEVSFKSSHWDDPNVLAHIRMADRTGPNGEKILHVEEIQSDWGQKGKKAGFVDPKDNMQDLVKEYDYLTKQSRALEVSVRNGDDADPATQAAISRLIEVNNSISALSDRMTAVRSNIPTAPYVTNTQAWTDLALKRALREAAEGGYDKLVWTPGAEQAKRYKLSNHVNSIDYMREGKDAYRLGITNKQGEGIDLPKNTFTAKELEEYLGKEVAQKIVDGEGKAYRGRDHKTLEGLDLEVGGKGMKGYYDKIVPTQLSKLVKKLDPEAKIEMGRMPVQNYTISAPDIARELGMSVEAVAALPHDEKMALINTVRHSIAAPSLTITPKMREAILKGQTAYAEGGEVEASPKKSKPAFRTIEEQVTAVASDLANIARKDNLDQRHVAYLLKVASGMYMPPERAMEFAGQIMLGDAEGLISRFKTYRPSIRTFARLNQMMGGKHKFMSGDHMGGAMMRMKGEEALMKTKENAESMMDSDVVKSRPAMKKALETFNKRI